MAKNLNNNATHGIRGKVDQLVYNHRNGRPHVSKPAVKTAPPSANQMRVVLTFKQAVKYATAALLNDSLREAYKAKCKRGQTPFNLAVADFFRPPEVHEVDFSGFTNAAGSIIKTVVSDNFAVVSVKVRIERPNGTLIEEGYAILDDLAVYYNYTVTTDNANARGNLVSIIATDTPGHSIVNTKTM